MYEVTSLREVKGVGDVLEQKFLKLGLSTVGELLDRLPKTYIDLSNAVPLERAEDGSFCLFDGVIAEKKRPFVKGNLKIFSCVVLCGSLSAEVVWFNSNFVEKMLTVGEMYTFYGKLKIRSYRYELNNPQFEKKGESTKFSGINPIYATKGYIPQGTYRSIVREVLSVPLSNGVLSPDICEKLKISTYATALQNAHLPETSDYRKPRERVVLERVIRRIAAFRLAKSRRLQPKKPFYGTEISYSKPLHNLPFSLTESQTTAVERIEKGLKSNSTMNAILCGDVGSGKTVVAMLACYFVIKNGRQSSIAAPTEILAKQHFAFANKLFSACGVRISLLTGSMSTAEKKAVYRAAECKETDLIVGTHALFSQKLVFADLGLAIADEQHRFGVAQRTSLFEKGMCDVLTLSATPIPRSMCLVAYGEAEFITLERRFFGNVKTRIVSKNKRTDMWKYVANTAESGGKIFIVAPKIYDEEGVESESCEDLVEELAHYVKRNKVALLHGKMRGEEKQKILMGFAESITPILVATTVVEVGLDVPDASVVIVTDADKFGLATLHQLRGRVGRNGQEAYCFLYSDNPSNPRLELLTKSNDGFYLAEQDFDLRGGGEVFGLAQSGNGLDGLNARTLRLAKKAADLVDLESVADILEKETVQFSLEDVTLN